MAKLYEYAVLRVVPRPERGEAINVGVVLHCPETKFLEARMHLNEGRLLSLDPALDPESVASHLEGMRRVCVGGPEAGALGKLSARERFGRVAAPRSTIVQPSPVHTGFSEDPREALERLLEEMVLPPGMGSREAASASEVGKGAESKRPSPKSPVEFGEGNEEK